VVLGLSPSIGLSGNKSLEHQLLLGSNDLSNGLGSLDDGGDERLRNELSILPIFGGHREKAAVATGERVQGARVVVLAVDCCFLVEEEVAVV
jgi:hypothetical protein